MMKKLLLCLLIILLLSISTACNRNNNAPENIFNAITFVSDFNAAAAVVGAPQLNLAELEPIIGTSANEDGRYDSLMAHEGLLNIGALMMHPNRIWSAGRPNNLEQATTEYIAMVMAAANLNQSDAANLVDQLLSTEESEFSLIQSGIRFTISVTEGNIISLIAEAE